MIWGSCWNMVKRMTHGERCLQELWERLQEKRRGNSAPWIVLRYNFVPPALNIYIQFKRHVCSWGMAEYSCRTQSLYPDSGYGLLLCFHALPDIIYRMCQVLVFKLYHREKVLGDGCSVSIWYVLTGTYLYVLLVTLFLTQTTFLESLLSLLNSV